MNVKVFKLKQGKEDQWREWCKQLQTIYRREAIATVLEEQGKFESFVLFNVGNDYYTVGISDTKLAANKEVSLNREHQRQKKECLEHSLNADVLYELDISK
ncbi:MAG: DUF6176 family protein, partial [Minisyncoccota bacterium]